MVSTAPLKQLLAAALNLIRHALLDGALGDSKPKPQLCLSKAHLANDALLPRLPLA
jgi:hypothetical protein